MQSNKTNIIRMKSPGKHLLVRNIFLSDWKYLIFWTSYAVTLGYLPIPILIMILMALFQGDSGHVSTHISYILLEVKMFGVLLLENKDC